jgi:hypothetical protein
MVNYPNTNGARMKKIIFTILSVSLVVTSFGHAVSKKTNTKRKY